MATYSTIITNNGKAMFASAATSSGRVNITHLAVGDGNGNIPTPKANQTQLVKEAHRVTVNSVEKHATNANWIEIGAIIPSSSGGYTVREIGLYAGNTLIAVGSFPATYKPTSNEGGAREMAIRIIIAVENASVVNVALDNSLVYATKQWVESNFVNHNEVIDNLTSTDTDKPLSANQGKALKDDVDGLTASKADKTTNLTAGNGLTGGGNLSANRSFALGTPGQITATSTNGVAATSHTHAIDKASTTVAGVVQLNDTLTSTDTNQALTAAQGKVLKDGLDDLTTTLTNFSYQKIGEFEVRKYPDGTMMQTCIVKDVPRNTTSYAGIARTFPIAFIEDPTITATIRWGGATNAAVDTWVTITATDHLSVTNPITSGFKFWLMEGRDHNNTPRENYHIHITAIGRWK